MTLPRERETSQSEAENKELWAGFEASQAPISHEMRGTINILPTSALSKLVKYSLGEYLHS